MRALAGLLLLVVLTSAHSGLQAASIRRDVCYAKTDTAYETERCRLDVYLPENQPKAPVLVWFHGGGLKEGNRVDASELATSLCSTGVAVVLPSYRLSPRVTYPAYVQDAAQAVSWVFANARSLGLDGRRIFVGGHSAGGYLSLMLALDKRWLEACGLTPGMIAGYIPVSGQTLTHSTVREERGLGSQSTPADDASPLFHTHVEAPPLLLLYGDKDLPARAEENALLVARLKALGARRVEGHLLKDRDHGTIVTELVSSEDPGRQLLLHFIRQPRLD